MLAVPPNFRVESTIDCHADVRTRRFRMSYFNAMLSRVDIALEISSLCYDLHLPLRAISLTPCDVVRGGQPRGYAHLLFNSRVEAMEASFILQSTSRLAAVQIPGDQPPRCQAARDMRQHVSEGAWGPDPPTADQLAAERAGRAARWPPSQEERDRYIRTIRAAAAGRPS